MVVLLVCGLAGCGSGAAFPPVERPTVEVPGTVNDEAFAELSRAYVGLALDDPARRELRQRLVAYWARRTRSVLEEGDYDAVITQFARMTDYFLPEDFARGPVPSEFRAIAHWIIEHGSPRGDESRVLSARLVLRHLEPNGAHGVAYDQVARWSREARKALPNPVEQLPIRVWEEHLRLTPTPSGQRRLADLYLRRREVLLRLVHSEGPRLPMMRAMGRSVPSLALVQRTPLDVAGVYLATGDVAAAIGALRAIEDLGDVGGALVRVLEDAQNGDDDALLEVAEAFGEGRPTVAQGVCRYGRRRNLDEPRFAVCLARVFSERGNFPEATGWYAEAVRAAPDDRSFYDEALDALQTFITRGIYDADPRDTRGMTHAAEEILTERIRRWPREEPSVSPSRLHYVIGLVEMNAGNPEEAKRRFEASVEARETAEAQFELGRLAEGTGDASEAVRHYRRALDLTSGDTGPGVRERARILEYLAGAYRKSGTEAQAARLFGQALDVWDGLVGGADGDLDAEGHLRRGVILDRLGRREAAVEAFRAAMTAAPTRREVYAGILSHLVVAAPAAPQFANEVFVRAIRELSLEPEWKVYFALWIETVAARAGETIGTDARAVLRAYSDAASWHGHLARFGVGDLPYTELLAEASSVGQRTEAYFYRGTSLLRSGDSAGARLQFERVLDTHLVNFYEYTMALELLRGR